MSAPQVDIDAETILFDGKWMSREEIARTIKSMLDGGNYNIGRHSAALELLGAGVADLRTLAFRATPELAESVSQAATKLGRTPGAVIREALAQYLSASRSGAAPAISEPKKAEPEGRRQTEPEMPAVHVDPTMTQRMPVPVQALQQAATPPLPTPALTVPAPLSAEPRTPPTPPPGLKPHVPATPIAGPGALKSAGVSAAPSVVVDQSLTTSTGSQVVTEAAAPEEAATAVELTPKPKDGAAGADSQEAVERRWFGG